MKDYSNYSMVQLEEMSKTAFSEYYKLAISFCPYPLENPILNQLQKAMDKYEEIRAEIEKRLISNDSNVTVDYISG